MSQPLPQEKAALQKCIWIKQVVEIKGSAEAGKFKQTQEFTCYMEEKTADVIIS